MVTQNYVDRLMQVVADCRDVFPVPPEGSELEVKWMRAMGDPFNVPDYVRAAHEAASNECERQIFVLKMLVASGHVTQQKVDQALELANRYATR